MDGLDKKYESINDFLESLSLGDRDSWLDFYRLFRSQVVSTTCAQLSISQKEAEDIFTDIYVKLFSDKKWIYTSNGEHHFNDYKSLLNYILVSMRHHYLDSIRRNKQINSDYDFDMINNIGRDESNDTEITAFRSSVGRNLSITKAFISANIDPGEALPLFFQILAEEEYENIDRRLALLRIFTDKTYAEISHILSTDQRHISDIQLRQRWTRLLNRTLIIMEDKIKKRSNVN